MKAIVYTSQTGFTKRYAELLSEATGVPAWSAKEAAKQYRPTVRSSTWAVWWPGP